MPTRPKHDQTLDIQALTDTHENPTSAEQWAILMPDGDLCIYGDHRWVRDGGAADGHPGGTLVRRAISITYGPWQDAAAADTRAELAATREAWARQAAVIAEIGRQLKPAARRARDGAPLDDDADLITELAERLIQTQPEP